MERRLNVTDYTEAILVIARRRPLTEREVEYLRNKLMAKTAKKLKAKGD